jgi:hypothetical protein
MVTAELRRPRQREVGTFTTAVNGDAIKLFRPKRFRFSPLVNSLNHSEFPAEVTILEVVRLPPAEETLKPSVSRNPSSATALVLRFCNA